MQLFKIFKPRQPHRVSRIPTEDSENEHDDEEKFLPFNGESPQERGSHWLVLSCFISMISIAVFSGAGGYYLGRNAQKSVESDPIFEDWSQSSTSSPSSCITGSSHDKYNAGLLGEYSVY
jgi:hypothetical protein